MMLNNWILVFLICWCPSSYTYSVTCFIPCRGSRLPCVLFSWVEPTTSWRMIKHGSVLTLDCSKLCCQTKFRESFSCHSAVCFCKRLLILPSHCTLCSAEGDKNSRYCPAGFTACSHFLNKACECHCPATVFSAFTQGCWSFPLIAHYAVLKGTRTAHTMQLDLLLASHFLNKACECHCPATVFFAFTQGCSSFPLIAHNAMLKGTRTAHTVLLDLLLVVTFWTRLASAIVLPQSFLLLHKAVDLSLSLHTMQCWRGQEQPILCSWIYCLLATFWTRLASAIVLPQSFLLLHKAVDLSLSLHTMQCWRGQEQPLPCSWIYCLLVTFWTRLASAIVLPQSFLLLHKAVHLFLSLHTMRCWRGQEQPILSCWIYCLLVTFWTRLASAIVLPQSFLLYTRLLIFPSHCTLCNVEGDKNSPYHAAGFTAC